jgi:hypothetical protein
MVASKTHKNQFSYHLINDNLFKIISQILSTNIETSIIIPHVCNNVNAFGAGFAEALSDKFPSVKANFHVNGPQKLGHTQFITAESNNSKNNKIIIANMIAQNGLLNTKNKRPLHYPSLVKCMYDVNIFCNKIKKETEFKVQIHAPKFGSGLAGGNWIFISELIDDIWNSQTVFVYHL